MPELPEVERVRLPLAAHLIGRPNVAAISTKVGSRLLDKGLKLVEEGGKLVVKNVSGRKLSKKELERVR